MGRPSAPRPAADGSPTDGPPSWRKSAGRAVRSFAVLALMILSERFFTPRRVERWLGRDSGPGAWLIAAGAGALATGPVYPWYALLAELRRKGMQPALVAVLLYARAIKLPLLPLMAHYFGAPFTLVLSGWILAFAWLSGLLMRRFATETAS